MNTVDILMGGRAGILQIIFGSFCVKTMLLLVLKACLNQLDKTSFGKAYFSNSTKTW